MLKVQILQIQGAVLFFAGFYFSIVVIVSITVAIYALFVSIKAFIETLFGYPIAYNCVSRIGSGEITSSYLGRGLRGGSIFWETFSDI